MQRIKDILLGALAVACVALLLGADRTREHVGWMSIDVNPEAVGRLGFTDPDWEKFRDDGVSSTGVYLPAFDDSILEEVTITARFLHNWEDGGDVRAILDLVDTSTSTNSSRWCVERTNAGTGEVFGTTVTVCVDCTSPSTAYQHYECELITLSAATFIVSRFVHHRFSPLLFRRAASSPRGPPEPFSD